MDLTLYRRPVFDTLTKVSSRAETCLGAPKVRLLHQYLHPKSVLWWLDYLRKRCPLAPNALNIGLQTIHYPGSPRSVGSPLVSRDAYFSEQTTSPFVQRSSRTTQVFPLETIKFSCFQLNLLVKAEKGDLSTFVTNGEWHLLGKEEKKNKRDDRLSCEAA